MPARTGRRCPDGSFPSHRSRDARQLRDGLAQVRNNARSHGVIADARPSSPTAVHTSRARTALLRRRGSCLASEPGMRPPKLQALLKPPVCDRRLGFLANATPRGRRQPHHATRSKHFHGTSRSTMWRGPTSALGPLRRPAASWTCRPRRGRMLARAPGEEPPGHEPGRRTLSSGDNRVECAHRARQRRPRRAPQDGAQELQRRGMALRPWRFMGGSRRSPRESRRVIGSEYRRRERPVVWV